VNEFGIKIVYVHVESFYVNEFGIKIVYVHVESFYVNEFGIRLSARKEEPIRE
jgi:hypothetical protein